ncbi:hypothetical protein HK414_22560 [Ramlibacter terrae]|uniref:Uncharacterized protein n=1 Tax=Ramlibacter terrae TaxID=2732511 RepID=A0ABX6P7V8_9BURK|nr:hypothetical protein HK414_22560 [Ramlibacter terrae]
MSALIDFAEGLTLVHVAVGLVSLFSGILSGYLSSAARKGKFPSLHGLVRFADLFGLDLRKNLKALAGDYDAEIRRLHAEKRYRMAAWNKLLAWAFAFWYVLRGPFDAVIMWAIKAWKGL